MKIRPKKWKNISLMEKNRSRLLGNGSYNTYGCQLEIAKEHVKRRPSQALNAFIALNEDKKY